MREYTCIGLPSTMEQGYSGQCDTDLINATGPEAAARKYFSSGLRLASVVLVSAGGYTYAFQYVKPQPSSVVMA